MSKLLKLGIVALMLATPAKAGPKHWLAHHKEFVAQISLTVAAWSLDARSSVICQRRLGPGCVENNAWLGPHPSPAATWGYAMGLAAAQSGVNAAIWHFGKDRKTDRVLTWGFTGTFIGWEAPNIASNYPLANQPVLPRRFRP